MIESETKIILIGKPFDIKLDRYKTAFHFTGRPNGWLNIAGYFTRCFITHVIRRFRCGGCFIFAQQ